MEIACGSGFTLLPIKSDALQGKFSSWGDAELSVLVALGVHASPQGLAWPSLGRLARLAGVSKSSVGDALMNLAERGWIRGRGRKYHVSLGEICDSVAIYQLVVFSGLWAACTPTARKLYLILRALSRPGGGVNILNWDDAVEEAIGEDGLQHVRFCDLDPSYLAALIGCSSRTYRDAMCRLRHLDLVRDPEVEDEEEEEDYEVGFDCLLLPNNPGFVMPGIVRSPDRKEGSPRPVSSGARRSAAWARKRAAGSKALEAARRATVIEVALQPAGSPCKTAGQVLDPANDGQATGGICT